MDDQSRRRRRMPAIMAMLLFAALFFSTIAEAATGRTFDGSWTIVFVTRSGACDPAYNFTVNISHGIVTHPNLVRSRGAQWFCSSLRGRHG